MNTLILYVPASVGRPVVQLVSLSVLYLNPIAKVPSAIFFTSSVSDMSCNNMLQEDVPNSLPVYSAPEGLFTVIEVFALRILAVLLNPFSSTLKTAGPGADSEYTSQ